MAIAAKPYRPGPWAQSVLAYVATYHYMTIPQLRWLMKTPAQYNNFTQSLKPLIDHDFLIRIERAQRAITNGKIRLVDHAYAFGPRGYTYAKRNGILQRKPRSKEDEWLLSEAFLKHTLTATDVLLSFRSVPGITILQEQQDQELVGKPFVVELDGQRKEFNADSTIVFTLKGHTYCCPIEVQNVGNISRVDLGEKVANYVALHEQNAYQRYFDIPDDTYLATLFVAVQGDVATRNIRIAMERALNHVKKPELGPLFRVAPLVEDVYSLPILPVWQRPYKPEERALFSV